jgi:two-component system response regulator HydG
MIAGGAIGLGPSLLIVDGDREMRRTLISYFEKRGFHVAAAASLASAKQAFATNKRWSLVIADYHLPDGTGRDLAGWVREQTPGTRVLLMSGSAHVANLCKGEDFFAKPFRLEKLEAYLKTALQSH